MLKTLALEEKGTYALVLRCPKKVAVRVGSLGEISIDRGYLVYVGSAFGPGGLAGRLRHHLRRVGRPHWHVDYIRQHTEMLGVWLASGSRELEHRWSSEIAALPNAKRPHSGFGSSDCQCDAHLFHMRRSPRGGWFEPVLLDDSIPGGAEFCRTDRLAKALSP
jgi:Uri superfamily endonuclease